MVFSAHTNSHFNHYFELGIESEQFIGVVSDDGVSAIIYRCSEILMKVDVVIFATSPAGNAHLHGSLPA